MPRVQASMEIVRNTDQNQFELHHEGAVVATLTYEYDGDATVLTRVQVEDRYSGQGVAAHFTEGVLAQLRANSEAVIPQCPYVRGFIVKNPQWRDIVPPDVQLSA